VRANEANVEHCKLILDGYNKTIFITVNIEHHTIVPYKAGVTELRLNVMW
jgi:hypothetical protein